MTELAGVLHKTRSSETTAEEVEIHARFDGYALQISARPRDGSMTATFRGVVREDEMGGSRLVGDIPVYPHDWFRRAVYGVLAVMSVAVGAAALNGENTIAGCALAGVVIALLFRGAWQSFPKERAKSEALSEELVAALRRAIA